MKQILKTLLTTCVLSISVTTASADILNWNNFGPGPTPPMVGRLWVPVLVASGGFGANPDRRRVAGSALIMKSAGTINEPSIPSNIIAKMVYEQRQNVISPPTFNHYGVSLNEGDVISIGPVPMEHTSIIDDNVADQYFIK